MNRAISELFGIALNVLHVFVLLLIAFVVTTGAMGMLIGIGISIGYLFLVGLASTLIAIREHLETLAKAATAPVAAPEPAVIRRREGVLNV